MIKNCVICDGKFETVDKRSKYCSKKCKSEGMKHTQATKDKISLSRKIYLKNNPDKHPWKKSIKFKSVPCEHFKKYLIAEEVSFVEEYLIEESDRNFSIDIAFPDKKIAIEINGNQHYDNFGNLKKYYQERHDHIESLGWTIYEIHYSEAFYPERVMSNIKLKKYADYSTFIEKQNLIRNRKKLEISKLKKIKEENKEKAISDIKVKILSSNIDFSSYGWIGKVAEIINISPQKVSNWMKRNMKEFYDSECFKRKSTRL